MKCSASSINHALQSNTYMKMTSSIEISSQKTYCLIKISISSSVTLVGQLKGFMKRGKYIQMYFYALRLTFCGTYEYMAPEIIQKKPYDYRVDIWSLGILLFELLHREPPFKGRSLPEISQSIAKTTIQYSSSINPEAKDLIKMILKTNASERPSFTEILNHPWVRGHLAKEEALKKMDDITSPRTSKLSIYNQTQNLAQHTKNDEGSKEPKLKPKLYHTERELSHESPLLKIKSPSSQSSVSQRFDVDNYKPKMFQENTSLLNLKTLGDHYNFSGLATTTNKSAMAKQMIDNLTYENGKKTPSTDNLRKKKIFETTLLSPTFKTKINSIISQLGPQTTAHKSTGDMAPILSSRSPTHQKTLTIFNEATSATRELGDFHHSEHSPYLYSTSNYRSNQQSLSSNLSPTNFKKSTLEVPKAGTSEGTRALSQSKTNFKATPTTTKIGGFRDENNTPAMTSSLSSSNLTKKKRELSRGELTSSQIGIDYTLKNYVPEHDRSRSPHYKGSNPLVSLDQNRNKFEDSSLGIQFNQFYKGLDHKRKSNFKSIDDYSSASTKQYSMNIDTKAPYTKENRPDFYLKESKSPTNLDRILSSRAPILKENL